MKKLVSILMLLLLAITIFPVAAQDEEMAVACSEEEFVEAATAIAEGFDEFTGMIEMSEEPTASELTEAAAALDAYSMGYWEGFMEALEEGLCAELEWFAYMNGFLYEDALVTAQLSALALHEAEAGNEDLANGLVELAAARAEALDASVTAMSEVMTGLADGSLEVNFDIVECSDEELEAVHAGLEEIATAYAEFGEISTEVTGTDLSALVGGYAVLDAGFWNEFIPAVPNCLQSLEDTFGVGMVLHQSLIGVASLRLAELESEMGNAELAELLAESAVARLEIVAEIMGGMEEE